jgi:hypothetical protein
MRVKQHNTEITIRDADEADRYRIAIRGYGYGADCERLRPLPHNLPCRRRHKDNS